ncbi:putative glycoside hydrolase family 18, catalytic domain, glycoside hydrolase superfamily [Helianthus annuus]|nr:putative glycoside hydrolase family 18, catalytic domain, glycoside hydrolase superfamily [Helianthus annuus]
MGRKRGRPEWDRRSTTSKPSGESNRPFNPNIGRSRSSIVISLLIFVACPAISLYLYPILYASNPDASIPNVLDVTYQQILTENAKVSENASRRFPNPVLAYVTPWNSKGYDLAKDFNSKFTHISPVWYHLKSQGAEFVLEGRHNVDKGWISDLRMKGHALILPRFVLEAIPMAFLKEKKQRAKLIDLIIAECKEMDYDGIVLESWSRWSAYGVLHDPHMRNLALKFIKKLGQVMHSVVVNERSLQLVYVIGPPHADRLHEYDFGPQDLQSLGDAVDGYSLMTYDFSNPQNPGPNAPLKWVHSTMQLLLADGSRKFSHKIFLGINFYGNDYVLKGGGGDGGGAILGRDYLSLLEKHKPELKWDKKSGEHFFLYSTDGNDQHVVFYPSLLSIEMRLDEARSWGAGISIWEMGQGLDYFFNLL